MLGALLVFQDCFKLNDFGHNKLLEMSVASDLLPRSVSMQYAEGSSQFGWRAAAFLILDLMDLPLPPISQPQNSPCFSQNGTMHGNAAHYCCVKFLV